MLWEVVYKWTDLLIQWFSGKLEINLEFEDFYQEEYSSLLQAAWLKLFLVYQSPTCQKEFLFIPFQICLLHDFSKIQSILNDLGRYC